MLSWDENRSIHPQPMVCSQPVLCQLLCFTIGIDSALLRFAQFNKWNDAQYLFVVKPYLTWGGRIHYPRSFYGLICLKCKYLCRFFRIFWKFRPGKHLEIRILDPKYHFKNHEILVSLDHIFWICSDLGYFALNISLKLHTGDLFPCIPIITNIWLKYLSNNFTVFSGSKEYRPLFPGLYEMLKFRSIQVG